MADQDEFERLILALQGADAAVPAVDPVEQGGGVLEPWLRMVADRGASDLLLVAGEPPALRIEGRVHRLGGRSTAWTSRKRPAGAAAARAPQYRDAGIADARVRIAGLGRFRINLHHERGRAAAAIRMLPARCRASRPSDCRRASRRWRASARPRDRRRRHRLGQDDDAGGAGRRDQPARRPAHHHDRGSDRIRARHQRSIIEQVEIGVDAPDFPTALRSALRQAPDVIVIGEMRDPETMRIALAAGETGHLVLSTLHTTDMASTVARMADSFPVERQHTIRQEMAMALAAVFVQKLMPRIGGGLMPAAELLMVGYGARQHIRKNALQHLHQEITITRKLGSFTLEESLARLVKRGVDRLERRARARRPSRRSSSSWPRDPRINRSLKKGALIEMAHGRCEKHWGLAICHLTCAIQKRFSASSSTRARASPVPGAYRM